MKHYKTFLFSGAMMISTAGTALADWTGAYVGGELGYGKGKADTKFDPLPSAAQFVNLKPQTLKPDPKGTFFGVDGGYNWQSSKLVYGVEGDYSLSNMDGSDRKSPITQNNGTPFPGAGFLKASQKTKWLANASRPRRFRAVRRLAGIWDRGLGDGGCRV